MCRNWLSVLAVLILGVTPLGAVVVDFEDVGLAAGSYYNGADGAGGFASRGVQFPTEFDFTYQSWSGFAASAVADSITPGYSNQYSAWPGVGADGSPTYAVAYVADYAPTGGVPRIGLPSGMLPVSVAVANTTYAALSIRNGDSFAKKFGGPTGSDPDWFRLTIVAVNSGGSALGQIEHYLADYRFTDSASDYVQSGWATIDLASLAPLQPAAIEFRLTSSDIGPFGMNTPSYVAIDNLVLVGATLAGDFTGDGRVDAGDFTHWRDAVGTTRPLDFDAWRANFGAGLGDLSLRTVPEPFALHLLLPPMVGLAATCVFRNFCRKDPIS